MRLGCVTSEIARIAPLAALGYDYVELRGRALAPMGDDLAFGAVLERLRDAPLKAESLSDFIPPFVGLRVVGPAVDRARLRRYTEMMLDRAARVGASTVVFGAGAARTMPDGFSRARALDQLREYLALAADLAGARSLVFALEHLNRDEANLVNSPAEAAEIVRSIGRPSLGVTIDHYHLLAADEPVALVAGAVGLIRHVHASGPDRQPPADGVADQTELLAALNRLGYDGRVSVESRFTDFEREAAVARQHLAAAWLAVSAPADSR